MEEIIFKGKLVTNKGYCIIFPSIFATVIGRQLILHTCTPAPSSTRSTGDPAVKVFCRIIA